MAITNRALRDRIYWGRMEIASADVPDEWKPAKRRAVKEAEDELRRRGQPVKVG